MQHYKWGFWCKLKKKGTACHSSGCITDIFKWSKSWCLQNTLKIYIEMLFSVLFKPLSIYKSCRICRIPRICLYIFFYIYIYIIYILYIYIYIYIYILYIYIYTHTVPSISIVTIKTNCSVCCGVKTFANMIKRWIWDKSTECHILLLAVSNTHMFYQIKKDNTFRVHHIWCEHKYWDDELKADVKDEKLLFCCRSLAYNHSSESVTHKHHQTLGLIFWNALPSL